MNLKYVLLVIMLFSLGTGCKESPQAPPDEPIVEEEVNPNIPNANELIISQRLLGDADKISNIWEIMDSGDGGFYFRGDYNNEYAIGKLDQAGQEVWVFQSRYPVDDFGEFQIFRVLSAIVCSAWAVSVRTLEIRSLVETFPCSTVPAV